ncbi:glycosyltransferase [Exiguobacterium mexicanum]|uniref:glycosyltransferase n=1 Tax=Exiguobacterium mexicanum TaxID=340146 RepID=UPI0037C17122
MTCLIVPDLPQFMNLSDNKNHLYNFLKNIEIKAIDSDKKYIDSYVLLTEQMKETLNITSPFTVIEGISTTIFDDIKELEKLREVKTILYTGLLSKKYGIVDLIEAFKEIMDENLELVICGEGEAKDYILEQSVIDSRIIYKGLLERRDVLTLQKSSTVLVNPRTNNDSYTKYSFPSKILEYMSSGTPVIAYKLDGMPDEYSEYLYTVDNYSRNGLKMKIEEVLNKPQEELSNMGMKARDFVLENKNKTVQTKKILEMINNI